MKKIICEVYSRVCGFFRPIDSWNLGKREEFKERKVYDATESLRKNIAREIVNEDVVKDRLSS